MSNNIDSNTPPLHYPALQLKFPLGTYEMVNTMLTNVGIFGSHTGITIFGSHKSKL